MNIEWKYARLHVIGEQRPGLWVFRRDEEGAPTILSMTGSYDDAYNRAHMHLLSYPGNYRLTLIS